MGITVRDATKADVPTILDIYNYEVLHGTATFDIEPKTLADRLIWFRETQRPPHRVIVVDDGAGVAGWGCLHPFHTRAAYRFTTEDSVYIHQNRRGEGIGSGVVVDLKFANAIRIREGLQQQIISRRTVEEALEALGLSE